MTRLKISPGYHYGFHDQLLPKLKLKKGLSEAVVRQISRQKQEPQWMLDYRLKALQIFYTKPLPRWGADLSGIDFDQLTYYVSPGTKTEKNWQMSLQM